MRMLLKIKIPIQKGNEAARSGALGKTISSILSQQNPESVYFVEDCGTRTGYVVVNVNKESEIPKYAEPWFLAFDAHVEFHPAMVPADLEVATADIQKAVENFG